ncbi:MAG: FkbM family methyltransferase [Thermodesulfovibrionales bacterium]
MKKHPIEYRSYYPDIEVCGLRKKDVIVDVGANRGRFIECVLAWQPYAVIHAFEPLPDLYDFIREFFKYYNDLYCSNIALGSENGQKPFFVSKYNQVSSFLEQGDLLVNKLYGVDYSVQKSISVEVQRLDDYCAERKIERLKLLKLDVQGYELEVLKGAGRALPNIEYIYLEAQFQKLYKNGPLFDEVFEYLNCNEFDLLRMTEFRTDDKGKLLECDMLFANRHLVEARFQGAERRAGAG